MSSRVSAREAILDAAEMVVGERGAAHLTLDAVAQRAEVSKGGLLYHFPSKEALLQAMLARLCDRFDEKKAVILQEEPADPAAALRAHLKTAFAYMKEHKRVSAAILAAGANNPKLLDPLRERIAAELTALPGDVRQVARGLVIMLAVDGLWFNELLETMSLAPRLRRAVMAELLALAETSTPAREEGT
jgi:AcrR family transcriptional regulator